MTVTIRLRSIMWFALGIVVMLAALVWVSNAWRADALPGDTDSTFVPVSPCRVMDTRPGSQVGPRDTPFGPEEPYDLQVTGGAGDCTDAFEIPASAVAISMNVTIVNPTAQSNLRLYPTGTERPEISNLNWLAGQSPTPNKVDVKLNADGQVTVENFRGTVDGIADVVGYYTDQELKKTVSELNVKTTLEANLGSGWQAVLTETAISSQQRNLAIATFELDEDGGSDITCGFGSGAASAPSGNRRWTFESRGGGNLAPITITAPLNDVSGVRLLCRSNDGDGALRNVWLTVMSTGNIG
ncbi:MAG: hypothetical protein AAGA42_20245 [Actinomycetota bacterium]